MLLGRAQGVERHVVAAARRLLVEKVQRLHIGTHHITIHQEIRQVLREDNWFDTSHLPFC